MALEAMLCELCAAKFRSWRNKLSNGPLCTELIVDFATSTLSTSASSHSRVISRIRKHQRITVDKLLELGVLYATEQSILHPQMRSQIQQIDHRSAAGQSCGQNETAYPTQNLFLFSCGCGVWGVGCVFGFWSAACGVAGQT